MNLTPSVRRRILIIAAGLVLLAGAVALVQHSRSKTSFKTFYTMGEVQTIHAEVLIGAREVRGISRFSAGDRVVTRAEGRARIRLDDGTTVVVDRKTELAVTDRGLSLERGRIFVRAGRRAHTEITAGSASTILSASSLAFERTDDGARIYCSDGEAVVRAGDQQERAQSGETAVLSGTTLSVGPEKAFNDWTGGMAAPWSAAGRPRATIGELYGKSPDSRGDGGPPLVVRSHDIAARVEGELAITLIDTMYFNGGSTTVDGDFRLAIPKNAIVSRFALRRSGKIEESQVLVGKEDANTTAARLEWAGADWVRGFVPSIPAGDTVGILVEYREWLPIHAGRMTYRYPMVTEGSGVPVGELRARIDVGDAHPRSAFVSRGATLHGNVIEYRSADVIPEADLVVELEVEQPPLDQVRAYVARPGNQDPKGDDYFLVRAELPAGAATAGVTLALVLDTSFSMSPSMLDAGRAVIESLIEGLGTGDRVAVLAADHGTRFVGKEGLSPVDPPRRQEIRQALASLRPGGAGDLGAALERAADLLPPDAPDAMVVYIGDGFPTLGDQTADALRARLVRRSAGVPRLAAVTIGTGANRFLLSTLVRGAGPLVEVDDRSDAAQAAVVLLTGALEPVIAGVEFDLGPTVDRIYPRGAQNVPANGTAMIVGRLRGKPPQSIGVRYRRGAEIVEERRSVSPKKVGKSGEVRRRWAKARLEDVIARGESVEPVLEVARRVKLLSPWTGFYVTHGGSGVGTPFSERLLAPSDALLVNRESRERRSGLGALFQPLPGFHDDEDFRTLIAASVRRTLESGTARAGVRRCRDARLASRPNLGGALLVRLTVQGSGRPIDIRVRATRASDDDIALSQCVERLIATLPFFDSGTDTSVTVDHRIALPPPRDHFARPCSQTSKLPLALRRTVWAERGLAPRFDADAPKVVELYLGARRACELPGWADQRDLLEMIVEKLAMGPALVTAARRFEEAGEAEAAEYLRRAAVRRARSPEELATVRIALIGNEPRAGRVFEKQYRTARSNEERLSVVRRFLRLSPHDELLRRLQFSLLEALEKKNLLVQAIFDARQDPFASAGLLADGASALRRLGREDEARRAFGEIVERAPESPYARAYLGDRLRDEGLFDDATAAYEALERMLPGDPAVALRLALAHAGAGRLDVATRVLDRVAQTGGRASDVALGELASFAAAVLLAGALEKATPDDLLRIERRSLEVPLPDVGGLVLIRTPSLDEPIESRLVRIDEGDAASAPDLSAPSMGLYGMRLERGDRNVRVRLRRVAKLASGRAVPVRIDVISFDENRRRTAFAHKELLLDFDKESELRLEGGTLL